MPARCFVNSMAQVSCRQPLSDEWFDNPCALTAAYTRAQEPDTKGLIVPSEARRMSKILKRAVATSITALNNSCVEQPDAIITGTGMGCMENSEKFLVDMCRYGENCLKPSLFMQSTHNTISSLIAIILKCHGYNNTYSHKGISFESALLDAFVQIKNGNIGNALVGAHDEVTPFMALVMKRTHPEYTNITETSVSAILSSTETDSNICEITDVNLFHNPEPEFLAGILNKTDDSLLLLGVNGNQLNDTPYMSLLEKLSYSPSTLRYKNIFGDNFSSPALAFYAAATILKQQKIPAPLYCDTSKNYTGKIDNITILNHCDNTAWSLIRLKKLDLCGS